MLTYDQKKTQLNISKYIRSRYEDDPDDSTERVVVHDKTWVHHLDPESKMQCKQWKHPGHPLLRNLIGFIQQGRWWPQSFETVKGDND